MSSIGLYHTLEGTTATSLLLAMLMIQMAVKAVVLQPDAAIEAVWWGLDVAWNLYVGVGTILYLCLFSSWNG